MANGPLQAMGFATFWSNLTGLEISSTILFVCFLHTCKWHLNVLDQMAAKRDKQESAWGGIEQWNKLRDSAEKVELVRTQRGRERLLNSIGVDYRRTKGERETKDHLKKDCGEGAKQGRVEALECSQGGGTEQRLLVIERVGLTHLLARTDWMVMMKPLRTLTTSARI